MNGNGNLHGIGIKIRFILIAFCLLALPLSGGIEQYFKKIGHKPKIHKIENIDFIYMINLDQRPEKFQSSLEELAPYNVIPFRFSAVNGWELTLEAINDLGVKYNPGMRQNLWGTYYAIDGDGSPHHEIMQVTDRNYFSHCMSRGAIGIVLSHCSILQDAYDSGYHTIWIMEDDVQVIQDPNIMSTLVKKLDNLVGKGGWDILFTDQDTKNQKGEYVPCTGYAHLPDFKPENTERFAARKDISADFRKTGARYGAYSMIVRKSGMKKILRFMKEHQIFLPYDMSFYLPAEIRMFCVRHDVVSTRPQAFSDNGAPRYKIP